LPAIGAGAVINPFPGRPWNPPAPSNPNPPAPAIPQQQGGGTVNWYPIGQPPADVVAAVQQATQTGYHGGTRGQFDLLMPPLPVGSWGPYLSSNGSWYCVVPQSVGSASSSYTTVWLWYTLANGETMPMTPALPPVSQPSAPVARGGRLPDR